MVTWDDVAGMKPEEYILVDVRSEMEYSNGHVEGAINIPVDNLRDRLSELDSSKTIVEYCQVGLRGYVADRILTQHGFKVLNVTGGYKSETILTFDPKQSEQNKFNADSSDRNNDNRNMGNGGDHNHGQDTVKSGKDTCGCSVSGKKQLVVDPDTQAIKEEVREAGAYDKTLDACGLCCPGPLMQVKASMADLKEGQILKVEASDPGFYEDIKAWCKRTNNELVDLKKAGGNITAFIKKSGRKQEALVQCAEVSAVKDNKTMVVFSGDLDKAIASFIIANGAASMGKKVTMFFTFWGLNILRKPEKVKVQKGMMDHMFGMMMPRGSKRLTLSKMNMMGMGGKMIRKVMKDKNVSSLEELIQSAIQSGIEIVACQMSMDVMGLRKEELIDGVKIGGVGYYLGEAEDSNVNLFI
jgi:peroxiredoxin family protein/TusA-related sulfurtransferase/rhodanese-related sulfurtransferase